MRHAKAADGKKPQRDVDKRQVSSFAQTNAVKGHVKDASGEPIMGATITAVSYTHLKVAQSNERYDKEVAICEDFYQNKVCGIIVSQAKDTKQ